MVSLSRNQKLVYATSVPSQSLRKWDQLHINCCCHQLPKYICVFCIFLLKPLLTSEQGSILEAKSILQSCILLQQGQPVPQVLVHCEGVSSDDATLEDWLQLSKTYPSLNLEDKVVFHGGGIFFSFSKNQTQYTKVYNTHYGPTICIRPQC